MTNPYLERLRTQAATETQAANPYLTRLRERSSELRTDADIATEGVTPDQYGEAIRVGQQTGVPAGVAVETLPALRVEAEQAERRRSIESSPVLARWLESRDNTAVSRDDLQSLIKLQEVMVKPVVRSEEFSERVRQRKSEWNITWDQARAAIAREVTVNNIDPLIGETTGREATFGNYLRGLGESVVESFRQQRAGLEAQIGDLAFGTDRDSPAMRDYQRATARIENAVPAFETDTARAVFGGLQSAAQAIPGVAASVVTGTPLPALAAAGIQVEAAAYGKYRERGATGGEALVGAVGEGLVELITEKSPMGVIVDRFGKVGAARFMAELLAKDVPGEQVATFAQDAIDTAVANPDKTWGDFLAERPDAAYQTLIATLVQAGTMGGASAVVNRFAGDELRRQQAATDAVARAAASTADATKLDALTEAAAAVKTTGRSPDATAEFVRMAESAGTNEIYIDVQQAAALFQTGTVEQLVELTGSAEQVAEAMATGGDLVIPLDRYVSRIATRPDIEQIKRIARLGPDRLSQADLESTDVAKVIESIVGEYNTETERDPVFDRVREQLIAAGRSKVEAETGARVVADRYATRAERRGQGETAAQVFEASGLTVERGEADGAAGLGQAALDFDQPAAPGVTDADAAPVTTTGPVADWAAERFGNVIAPNGRPAADNFVAWFGDSKVVDESGAPLVVYHGTQHEIDKFRIKRHPDGTRQGRAIWFTDSADAAATYSGGDQGISGANMVSAYVTVKNPLVYDAEGRDWQQLEFEGNRLSTDDLADIAEERGHDGLVIKNLIDNDDSSDSEPSTHIAAFNPTQIKSAIGNRGTYDPNDPSILNQAAYHGTPHQFDRFSLDAIGTGEGAQAFGWGLYFAENPGVAEGYRNALSIENGGYPVVELDDVPLYEMFLGTAASSPFDASDIDREYSGDEAKSMLLDALSHPQYQRNMRDAAVVERVKNADPSLLKIRPAGDRGGALYTVDIPDEATARFLDWDKPLSQQVPAVQDAIDDAVRANLSADDIQAVEQGWTSMTGADLYRFVSTGVARSVGRTNETAPPMFRGGDQATNDKAASQALAAAGIPGIRYLDQGSRSDGDGTRNLVVFDDSLITITHKDGSPVTAAERASVLEQSGPTEPAAPSTHTPGTRGFIDLSAGQARIVLGAKADKSTFMHEAAHLWLFEMIEDAAVSPTVAADLDTVLEWFGMDVRTADGLDKVSEALRVDVAREQHEKWARGFEAYLRSGKAPSSTLAEVFTRFRTWLTKLYRDLRALNVEITPEVSAVMDRLIATDEAIAEASREQSYTPAVPVDEMRRLGLSPTRVTAYARSLDEARAELTARTIGNLERNRSRERREALRANLAAVNAETIKSEYWNLVEILARNARLDGQPVPPGLDGAKLNADELSDPLLGYAVTAEQMANLRRLRVYTTGDGGMAADYIASMAGLPSGQTLIDTLAASPTRREYIRDEAERRTQAEFPDVLTDGTLKTLAMEALHNNKQMQALQSEIELLAELANQPAPPARFVREAAVRIVASKTPADTRPNQYLVQERRAAREATKFAAQGKYAEALVAKRRQALNAALYNEALDAARQVERLDRLMKRLDKRSTRETVAKGGQDYLIQIDQLRVVYGYTPMTPGIDERWASLRTFVDKLQEAGEVTAVSERNLVATERRTPRESSAVTVGELLELRDAVRNLMTLATQANKIRRGDELVDRNEAIEEMVARAELSGIDLRPLPRADREMALDEQFGNSIDRMANDLLRPENVFEALDGGESGPWHDFWFAALDRAEQTAAGYRKRVGAQLRGLREQLTPEFLNTLSRDVTIRPGLTMPRSRLLAVVLNTGNDGNTQRVQTGGVLDDNGVPVQFTADDVVRLRELLTDAELTYTQGLWDTVNSLWPDIVELQRRVSGVPVDKVQAASFTVRGRDYRGGYWPLAYDRNTSNVGEQQANDDALRMLMGQGVSRAMTPKGYQKSRVEEFSAPLLLDFGAVLVRHVDQVITDLAYREPVKHISGLLRSERIKAAVLRRFGTAGLDNLKGQLAYSVSANDAIAGQVARDWRRFGDRVLANVSVSALAIRPDIMLGNYASGIIQGLDRTGLRALMRGWWQQNAGRRDTAALIRSKSPFMTARLDELDHWYSQELRWADGDKLGGFGAAYRRVMMSLHRAAGFEVEKAVWVGRYLREREVGKDEAEAIRLADKSVRQTQTAGGRKDVSTFERDASFRQTRQFMGPMFVIFGRLNESFRGVGNSRTAGERAVRILIQVFLAPAMFALAAGRWPTDAGDDEDDEWLLWLAVNTLLFPVQTLPLLRDAATAAEAVLTDNPVNPRAAPVGQAIGQMFKAGKSLANNIEQYGDTEELNYYNLTRDLTTIAGPVVGVPASQIRITTRGIEAMLDDDEDDRNMALMMLYGPPRK